MRTTLLATLAVALCGAAAGAIVEGARRPLPLPGEPHPHRDDWTVTSKPGEARRVTATQWLETPFYLKDFDFTLDVELGEDTVLDVLVRRVEPRLLRGELLPFHGRFAVL